STFATRSCDGSYWVASEVAPLGGSRAISTCSEWVKSRCADSNRRWLHRLCYAESATSSHRDRLPSAQLRLAFLFHATSTPATTPDDAVGRWQGRPMNKYLSAISLFAMLAWTNSAVPSAQGPIDAPRTGCKTLPSWSELRAALTAAVTQNNGFLKN